MKKNFLVTTSLDQINKKNNLFFLGYHCISEKNLKKKDYKNIISDKTNLKNILKNYWTINKVANDLLKLVSNRLNAIHDNKFDDKYWKVILFPWICSYTTICLNRWQTVEKFKKKFKKKYYSYRYIPDEESFIKDHVDFVDKSLTDLFNNELFIKIFEYQNLKNVLFLKKGVEKDEKIKKSEDKKSFKKLISSFFNRILLFFNRIYFDKFWFPKKDFIKICVKNFQFPTKNINTLNVQSKNTEYDFAQREILDFKIADDKNFKNFLLENIKYYMPLSYLENFQASRKRLKIYVKKRLIFSMSWFWWDDNFKIFLAESFLKGSRLINGPHGAGVHSKYSENYSYLKDLSHKIFSWSKKNIDRKKSVYLSPTLPVIKKSRDKDSTKLLINYYEPSKFLFKITLDTGLEDAIDNFNELMLSTSKLKKNILKEVKFRPKGNYSINSAEKFSKKFGNDKLEITDQKDYLTSISESKMVICYYPQTSFTESIYLNVPTLLITSPNFFDTHAKKMILKKFKKNNIFFNNSSEAFKFINKNWNKIDKWWNNPKTQDARQLFLDNFFDVKQGHHDDWNEFIKKEYKNLR